MTPRISKIPLWSHAVVSALLKNQVWARSTAIIDLLLSYISSQNWQRNMLWINGMPVSIPSFVALDLWAVFDTMNHDVLLKVLQAQVRITGGLISVLDHHTSQFVYQAPLPVDETETLLCHKGLGPVLFSLIHAHYKTILLVTEMAFVVMLAIMI